MQLLPHPRMITIVCLKGAPVPPVQSADHARCSVDVVFAPTVVVAAACQRLSSHGFVVAPVA